jgi:ADP-dependent NAD(P)H-hydrate dehydratase / NAD(P)H-hydrate epimerase
MAGMACLRSGAGLATIATPKSVLTSVAGYAPELMTEALAETEAGTIALEALDRWDELTSKMTVLAIGPGLTQNPETVEFVREALRRTAIPTVIDADGLNALDGHTELLKEAKAATIITPHPGEMARLCGTSVKVVQADRIGIAREFAASRNTIVVLKGYKTVVASPSGETWINCTGNPGMATGGTGDVLTGITAGLLAQHPQEPLLCAIAAVHLHGLAGDAAKEHVGEMSLMATDLIHLLPETFRRAKKSLQKRLVTLN